MNFLNKTIKGGIFLIIPLALVIVLIGKVFGFLKPLATSISERVFTGDILGVRPAYLLTILLIILICFVAGLVATSAISRSMVHWIEENVLAFFPGYKLLKTTSQAAIGMDESKNYEVVLSPIDGWMITFLIERLDNGEVIVFVPGSPRPWSGNIVIFKETEIRPTKMTQKEALSILRQTGIGLNKTWNPKN